MGAVNSTMAGADSANRPHPIQSAFIDGICLEAHKAYAHGLHRAAVLLVLCAVDQISYAALPPHSKNSTRKAYIEWCDKYFATGLGSEISGEEIYAARCALVHRYGTIGKLHTDGTVKRRLEFFAGVPRCSAVHPLVPSVVAVEVGHFVRTFLIGVVEFVGAYEAMDTDHRAAVNSKLYSMFQLLPVVQPV